MGGAATQCRSVLKERGRECMRLDMYVMWCVGCRVFVTLSHPSGLMTHAPLGMVSAKVVVRLLVRVPLLGLCVCRCTRYKCCLNL
jgi:hypothetical protein